MPIDAVVQKFIFSYRTFKNTFEGCWRRGEGFRTVANEESWTQRHATTF